MLVFRRTQSDRDIIQLKQSDNIFNSRKYGERLKKFFSEINYLNLSFQGHDLFSNAKSLYNIGDNPLVQKADIIHLHWIANMVDYREFFPKVGRKPIVWTLYDMNHFTGGCHYTQGCLKYETGCGNCPQLNSGKHRDLSWQIFNSKRKLYQGQNIHIFGISRWITDCARRSLLFRNSNVDLLRTGLPLNVFKKRDRRNSRKAFGLPQNKVLILFVSDYKTSRKGFEYLLRALRFLGGRIDFSKVGLVTFGAQQECKGIAGLSGISLYHLGHIHDQRLIPSAYSSADICAVPSLEDVFPLACLESMACGVPVVGFNAGGLPDMIIPDKTGLLAELRNSRDLADKMGFMISHPFKRRQMGRNARELVEERYTVQIQAERYREIYKDVLKSGRH